MIIQVVRSSAFTPVFERAVEQVHEALRQSDSGLIALRLVDVSAILLAALQPIAPQIANCRRTSAWPWPASARRTSPIGPST